jgi:Arc/MetJ family transcription regulator
MLSSMLTELETMKATISIDDELFAQAQEYAGVEEKSAVISEALKAYVQREAARRLARLGGTEPQLRPIPRRRSR